MRLRARVLVDQDAAANDLKILFLIVGLHELEAIPGPVGGSRGSDRPIAAWHAHRKRIFGADRLPEGRRLNFFYRCRLLGQSTIVLSDGILDLLCKCKILWLRAIFTTELGGTSSAYMAFTRTGPKLGRSLGSSALRAQTVVRVLASQMARVRFNKIFMLQLYSAG